MKKKKNSIHVPRLWRLEHWKLHIAHRQWRSNSPRRGRKPYIRERKTYSHILSGFCNGFSRGWQRKSTTRRFAADRLLPFTWKTPSAGKTWNSSSRVLRVNFAFQCWVLKKLANEQIIIKPRVYYLFIHQFLLLTIPATYSSYRAILWRE